LAGQVLYFGILAVPIWLAGIAYFFTDAGKRYRALGVLFVTVLIVLTITRAKPYYSGPAFPLVFAAGGAVLGRWFDSRRALRGTYTVALCGTGVLLALITLPLLPLSTVDATAERLFGWAVPPMALTHDMHDEFGWPEQVEAVAEVFATLSADERETATIFTHKYDQASAVNLYGEAHGLPRASSGHMTHYLWGPDEARPGPVVLVGASAKELATICVAPEEVARFVHPVALDTDVPIYVCREHAALPTVWPELKKYVNGEVR
jgi:hypothetical protein